MKYIIYRIKSENEYDGYVGYAAGRKPRGTEKLGEATSPEEAQKIVDSFRAQEES